MMNANQRQGTLAEMRIALLLVEHGCAVNSMTQMDFGLDLNVQVPRRIPSSTEESWEMTQQTANLQIKSSRSDAEQASVPYAVAAEWASLHLRNSPTILVLSIRDHYYAFDTARIRFLAERSLANRRRKLFDEYSWDDSYGEVPGLDETTVSFSAANGLRVSADLLPKLVVYWTINATGLDALSRLGFDFSQGLGAHDTVAALRFVQLAVAAYATKFYDYEEYKHVSGGGSEDTFRLARDLITAVLGESQSGGAEATKIVSSIPITPHGWGQTPELHHLTPATEAHRARGELLALAEILAQHPLRAEAG